jgi:P-type E1-E2 ATPase
MAATIGLTEAEAERRRGEREPAPAGSRSTFSIVRENTLTLFNLILGGFAVALLLTGQFSDLVFALVVVVNAAIGTVQELRAKRVLDELALLVAPRARVVRDGTERSVAVEEVVAGDAIRLQPGEQVVADGTLLEARGLQLDESILTGEADPVSRRVGDEVQSGSYCVAGAGLYRAERVGAEAYANEVTSQAQADRRPLSPLQLEINRLLRLLLLVMLPLGVAFVYALHAHATPVRSAVSTATAGLVSIVPEGLVLLTSVTLAVAAARIARRGALVQRLPAIEALAGVHVVCADKTGTLTDGALRCEEVVPLDGRARAQVEPLVGAFAASLAARNPTADALAEALRAEPRDVRVEVPFSSRWKWSGLAYADGGAYVLGAPDALEGAARLDQAARDEVERRARRRLRVLLFARAAGPLREPEADEEPALPPLEPLALVALSERMRADAADFVGYLAAQGVEVKVISGDGPTTVEAVARSAGIDAAGRVVSGPELADDDAGLAEQAERNVVFARVQPDQKRRLVDALARSGRRVAMIGDGVNDVAALKRSDVAVALGSGSQIAKGVADLVLVDLRFSVIPETIGEGRRILRNVRRVAKLFVSKSVFAALLILTIGIGGGTYPFLPRQLSLTAAFTVGIPALALALAPPGRDSPAPAFLRDVFGFAIPAGAVTAAAVLLGHGLVHTALGRPEAESQTTSVTILTLVGLYLVLVLESSSLRASPVRRRLVPLLCVSLAALYVVVLWLAPLRRFFSLAAPSLLPLVVALVCTVFAVGALGAVGLSLTRPGGERVQLVRFWRREPPAG